MDETIRAELEAQFLEHLEILAAGEKQITRLEQDVARLGVAASMAATNSQLGKPAIIAMDSGRWYRAVELTPDALLCHRTGSIGAEYAILECMPEGDVYQTSFTSWNSLDVLQDFIHERKELLTMSNGALRGQIRTFLMETYPQYDAVSLADQFQGRKAPVTTLPSAVARVIPEASQTMPAFREAAA